MHYGEVRGDICTMVKYRGTRVLSTLGKLVKRKRAFEHAQHAQIQIILRMRKVPSGPMVYIHILRSIKCFC